MLTLPITKDQLLFLIDQLSETEKQEILQHLIQQQPLDPDDTPDEVVIAGIRQGFKEAFNGQLIPLEQMWEAVDVESFSL
jgi:hypothetical protein